MIFGIAYFTYVHGAIGQTPGKTLLNLKVIREKGKNMTYGIAFLRWLSCILSGIFLDLSFLWVTFDNKKQGWYDMIASTVVVLSNDGE